MILMKDELGGREMEEFNVLRPNIYSCLTNNVHIDKGQKPQKRCVIKQEAEFNNYIIFLKK